MYSKLPGWKTVANFADVYISQQTGKSVNRSYIYQLVKKETAEPNSTELDVMEVDGVTFVKYRTQPTTSQERAAKAKRSASAK